AFRVEEMGDPGDPAVDLDQPGVSFDVEPVPLLAELGRGPVRGAVDGDLECLEDCQRIVEAVRAGAYDVHRGSVRAGDRADAPARRTLAYVWHGADTLDPTARRGRLGGRRAHLRRRPRDRGRVVR